MNAYSDGMNVVTVPMAQPVDVGGLTNDDLVVDAIDLDGFTGRPYFIKITVMLGNVAVDCDDFDIVTSASADLSTPTVVQALTEPTAAGGDNDNYVFNINKEQLNKTTQRYLGIRYNSGDGAALVAMVAHVWVDKTYESLSDTGKNFNSSAKTVTVANAVFS